MATYFHGSSEIQAAAAAAAAADGMQTLYLVNPSYVPFSDTPHQPPSATNTLFLNPAGNALTLSNLSHAQTPNHPHLVGIPLPTSSVHFGPTTSDDPARSSSIHGIVPPAAGVHHYNLWGPVDQNSGQITVAGGAHDMALFRRPPPPVVSPTRQGLSLSLSSQQQQVPYRTNNVDHDMQKQPQVVQAANTLRDDMRVFGNSPSSVSIVSNGVPGMQSVIFGSKYLRAAQELLDEVVNVETAMKPEQNERTKEKMKEMTIAAAGEGSSNRGENENATKHAAELSTAQRQELQMKKAKLLSMLEEVEQRYRQYHQQMQIVVSSFEQAAGFGSAKSYTALALQTISKQFRCLKDAISGQIKATSKNLGEEDCLGAKVEGSRLRYVDHHLRQQRALQQLGMIQHNAWRPQRGLPERAVSVLRAWLFEHFLHPYPKDSDKHLLAKQTGLTRSQVSNWFINARVRLWKPMVEEMYLEEIKEQERKGSGENTSKNEHNKEPGPKSNGTQDGSTSLRMDQVNALQPKQEKPTNQNNTSTSEFSNSINVSASPIGASLPQHSGFNLIVSSDMEGVAQRSPKKPRSHDMQNSPSSILSVDMEMKHGETSREINIGKFGGEGLTKDGYTLITGTANHGGYGGYPMGDIGRFNHEQLTPRFHGNSVSLTLGLTHCENLSLSGNQQNFLSSPSIQLGRRLELGTAEPDFCGINTSQPPHSGTSFENIDIHNRKRFAAELLPDFVV